MSVDATKWAWSLTIPPTRKIVLLSMADRAGETHVCWPSIARLEADTCLDRKTILAAISELEGMGLVVVSRSLGNGNSYRLVGVNGRENEAQKTPKKELKKPLQNTDSEGDTSTNNGTATSTENGTSTNNGTSTENGTATSTKNGTPTSTKNGTLNLPLNPNGINHGDLADQNENQTQTTATLAGAVCVALKAVGMGRVSPSNLMLKTLIDSGADLGVFVDAGKKAVENKKGFEYMLAIVKNQMSDCASFAEKANAPSTSSGILPGAI
jgi:hypothetical protein